MRYYRPTIAQINLRNLAWNLRLIRRLVSPRTSILVTIKADAYGHGLIPVARKLVALGVDAFGIASIDEGIQLREAGITIPVLVLGAVLKSDIAPLLEYGLTATVCDPLVAAALDARARKAGKPANIHVKVDTGMGRIGVLHHDAGDFVQALARRKFLNIEGIFTHLAAADSDARFTRYQMKVFDEVLDRIEGAGVHIPLVHCANSMGIVGYEQSRCTMVRPGLMVYGLYPKEGTGISLKPVLSLKTKVVFVKDVPAGSGVSYGRAYVTSGSARIVTLPIGYGDGYPRNLSNKAPVLIGGRRFTISGRICMDQIMVDVGDFSVKTGDEAVLIGRQGSETVTVEELAGLSGTIPYEIVCGLGSRIPRVYVD